MKLLWQPLSRRLVLPSSAHAAMPMLQVQRWRQRSLRLVRPRPRHLPVRVSALADHMEFLEARCADCEELVSLKDSVSAGGSRCKARRCHKCHGARKVVRAWYKKAGRDAEWEAMSMEERKEVIRNNKDKGQGRGKAREVYTSEQAECNDYLRMNQDKPFLTEKQLLG